jgi:hypothetical protein
MKIINPFIALVNFVLDYKPGKWAKKPQPAIGQAKVRRSARVRPVKFEAHRDPDGVMRIKAVVK